MYLMPDIFKSSTGKTYTACTSVLFHHDFHGHGSTILEAIKDLQNKLMDYNDMIIASNQQQLGFGLILLVRTDYEHLMVDIQPRLIKRGKDFQAIVTNYHSDYNTEFSTDNANPIMLGESMHPLVEKITNLNEWTFKQNCNRLPEFGQLCDRLSSHAGEI